jgi:hypothetical protein
MLGRVRRRKMTEAEKLKQTEIQMQFFEYGYNSLDDKFILHPIVSNVTYGNYILPLKFWIRNFVMDKTFREEMKDGQDVYFSDLWKYLIEVKRAKNLDQNSEVKELFFPDNSSFTYEEVERNTIPVEWLNINLDITV